MSFVTERERRANAGNRMRALLDQEMDMEVLFEENESDDEEFITRPEDEPEDRLDSDFDINSSEGEEEQEELGKEQDKVIQREERQTRRPALRHQEFLHKPRPKAAAAAVKMKPRPVKVVREAEGHFAPRQSLRTNTVLNRIQVEEQIRESKMRRSQLPKRDRPTTRHLTQEELLAEAAITEQQNKASLKQWQQMEEERRAKAKKKDTRAITGRFVRFHSLTDGKPEERPKRRKIMLIASKDDGGNAMTEITDPDAVDWQTKCDIGESEMVGRNLVSFLEARSAEEMEQGEPEINTSGLNDRQLDRVDIIPELEDWLHRDPRPLHPVLCPITGTAARYRDPATLTPFADKETYATIQSCLSNEWVWCPSLGIYVGKQGTRGATGVPEGWQRMLTGKRQDEGDWLSEDGQTPQYPKWLANKKTGQASSSSPTTRRSRHLSSPSPSSSTSVSAMDHTTTSS
ncbi:YL1 nuclear protein-domain-containing protein [Radiomyces spectabilis]|uniref:YL1 nuclear protein-domain-containing protein n=1 Tax=Radiomyces spectabilis TaxID=64574 RepID=UPI00221EEFDA|nr:YL1 nuclear protein-domain-containing protein [Radiomyces spectabilis]KAI8376379.1 YL1 nuclear protein-domain-containing protein [Radiomyces spectabilis]